jgi:hypothetical protein
MPAKLRLEYVVKAVGSISTWYWIPASTPGMLMLTTQGMAVGGKYVCTRPELTSITSTRLRESSKK